MVALSRVTLALLVGPWTSCRGMDLAAHHRMLRGVESEGSGDPAMLTTANKSTDATPAREEGSSVAADEMDEPPDEAGATEGATTTEPINHDRQDANDDAAEPAAVRSDEPAVVASMASDAAAGDGEAAATEARGEGAAATAVATASAVGGGVAAAIEPVTLSEEASTESSVDPSAGRGKAAAESDDRADAEAVPAIFRRHFSSYKFLGLAVFCYVSAVVFL